MEQDKRLVTIKQAAEILECSTTTVRNMLKRGMFDDCYIDRKLYLDRLDVENAKSKLNPNMLKPRPGAGKRKKI